MKVVCKRHGVIFHSEVVTDGMWAQIGDDIYCLLCVRDLLNDTIGKAEVTYMPTGYTVYDTSGVAPRTCCRDGVCNCTNNEKVYC